MIQIVIDPEYKGPTILDWGGSSHHVEDEFIEVQWGNTKQEIVQLEHQPDCSFRLFVPDFETQERTAASLKDDLELTSSIMATAKLALNERRSYDWRNFSDEKSLNFTRGILTKLSADAIRRGKESALTRFTSDFVSENGINPTDADVLLRLGVLKG